MSGKLNLCYIMATSLSFWHTNGHHFDALQNPKSQPIPSHPLAPPPVDWGDPWTSPRPSSVRPPPRSDSSPPSSGTPVAPGMGKLWGSWAYHCPAQNPRFYGKSLILQFINGSLVRVGTPHDCCTIYIYYIFLIYPLIWTDCICTNPAKLHR